MTIMVGAWQWAGRHGTGEGENSHLISRHKAKSCLGIFKPQPTHRDTPPLTKPQPQSFPNTPISWESNTSMNLAGAILIQTTISGLLDWSFHHP